MIINKSFSKRMVLILLGDDLYWLTERKFEIMLNNA